MAVEFTQNAETKRVERLQKSRTKWALFSSSSMVEALRKARDLGWKEKEVQVRVERQGSDMVEYIVEPYEKDCGCPRILKYDEFFD